MLADAQDCGIESHPRVIPIDASRGEAMFRSKRRRRPLIVNEDYELLAEEHGPAVEFDAAVFDPNKVWVATRVQRDFTSYHGVTADEAISNIRLLLSLAVDKGRYIRLTSGAHALWWRGYKAILSPDLATVVRYRTNHFERTPQMVVDGVKSRLGRRSRTKVVRVKRPIPVGLAVGDVLDGVVANVVTFGAFVDIGDFEGLVHKSQMGTLVENPASVVAVGEMVRVRVLSIDHERQRVELALADPRPPA